MTELERTYDLGDDYAKAVVLVDSTGAPVIAGGSVPGATETKITAATMPAGGVGWTGWLSAIWYALAGVASGAADSGNPVKVGGVYNTTLPTLTNGQRGDAQVGLNGDLRTLSNLVATAPADGVANSSGNFGINGNSNVASGALRPIVAPMKFNGTSWDRDRKPNAASRIPSAAATTNATSAKASAGDLHIVNGNNASGAIRYIKFYNKATAPTVGTDTPVLTLALPSGAFGFNLNGFYFSTGIAYALTTGAPDADTGALTLADVLGLTVTYA